MVGTDTGRVITWKESRVPVDCVGDQTDRPVDSCRLDEPFKQTPPIAGLNILIIISVTSVLNIK